MFPKAKNIESAFQHVRFFTGLVVVGSMIFCCFVSWLAYRAGERATQRIYVLSSGKVLEAVARDRRDNIPVEARDHIRNFHEDFFTLDPDEKVINANLARRSIWRMVRRNASMTT